MLPIIAIQIVFLIVSIAGPLIFSLISAIPSNCKTAPNYSIHIIFLVNQFCLIGLSIWLHIQKVKTQYESNKNSNFFLNGSQDSPLIRSQGRCCRELITHIKLVDTYTNLCFVAILINTYFGINTSQPDDIDSLTSF